jgi:hypothetical protein
MASLLSTLGIDALSAEQRWQLLQELRKNLGVGTKGETDRGVERPLTEEEFQRRLLEIGLMSQVPTGDDDEDDLPVPIRGEPLSETVIRERR